jgi:hypothetical protein
VVVRQVTVPTQKTSADTGKADNSDSPAAFAKTHPKISMFQIGRNESANTQMICPKRAENKA